MSVCCTTRLQRSQWLQWPAWEERDCSTRLLSWRSLQPDQRAKSQNCGQGHLRHLPAGIAAAEHCHPFDPRQPPSEAYNTGMSARSKAAKTVTATIKLLIPAAGAKPAPPVGPALGQAGLNIMSFCKDFNAKTSEINVSCQCFDCSQGSANCLMCMHSPAGSSSQPRTLFQAPMCWRRPASLLQLTIRCSAVLSEFQWLC